MPAAIYWFSGTALFLAGSFVFTIAVGLIGIREMVSDRLFLGLIFAAVNLGLLAWYTAAKQERDSAELRTSINKIAGSANVNPNQSAQALADEIIKRLVPLSEGLESTKKQVESIINPPRNPAGIYIGGNLVGRGINATLVGRVMQFMTIETRAPLNEGNIFEFGNYRLRYLKSDFSSIARMPGGIGGATYQNATAEVLGEISK